MLRGCASQPPRPAGRNRDLGAWCVADGEEFYPTTFTDGVRNRERFDRFGNELKLNTNGDVDAEIGCSWGRSGSQVWIDTDVWGDSTRVTW